MQQQDRKCHQGVENATSMCIVQCKEKQKRRKYRGDEIFPRQLIQYFKIEIAALSENNSKVAGISSETDGAP